MTTTTNIRMGLTPQDSQDLMPGDSVDVSAFTFDEVDVLLPVGETTGPNKAVPTSSPLESTGAGLHINLIPEASVSNAPSWFVPSVQTAANLLEQAFSDNITLNITYGWGTIGGSPITSANTALGGAYGFSVAYSTLRSWLSADARSTDDTGAVISLPTSTSVNNRGSFAVSTAQEKALGHFTGDPNAIDGQIGFGTGWTSGAIVGAALHELTHAMGRVSGWNMDLFRFSAPGAYQFTLGQAAYFSIDGGNTHLANFGRTSDTGDWLTNGSSTAPFTTNDPFNESINSSSNALTAVDLTIMDVLGFDRAGIAPPPDDYADSLADATAPFGQVAVNGANTGTLEVMGDRDWFGVQLTAGWSYVFNLEGAATGAGTLSDPYLRFHDSAGAVLAQNDDVSSTNLNSQLAFVATASGTYYLEAGGFSDAGAGTYRVSVSGTAPTVTPPNAAPPTTPPSTPPSAPAPAAFNTIARPGDFNGDGRDDLLWNTDDGQVVTWHMNGSQVASTQTIGSTGPAWHVVGTGDFNGNGQDDILWRNDSGQVVTWLLNGGQLASATAVGSAAPGWHIAGTGDFNSDGRDDILWHSDTGQVVSWLMNGGQINSISSVGSAPMSAHIAGTGDFNGDGRTDILWRSENGQVSTWLMNGGQLASATAIGSAGSDWHIAATGDLNGDGRDDIIWRNEDGRVSTWLMNGGQLLAAGNSGTAGTAWHIAGTGDLNGDGRDEILWRNDDGHVAQWLMNGTQLVSAADLGSVETTWHIGGSQFDLV